MNLDGVRGDRRKAIEPEWVRGMEPMYRPMPHRLSAVECPARLRTQCCANGPHPIPIPLPRPMRRIA